MSKKKKISTSLPEDLLAEACRLSKLNQTEALIEGLRELVRRHGRKSLVSKRGTFHFEKPTIDRERLKL